jgi:alginate O-acetyltransferase complex protein AlgI
MSPTRRKRRRIYYLYIPMGGDRGGRWATYRNLMVTMLLGCLWRAAGFQFII